MIVSEQQQMATDYYSFDCNVMVFNSILVRESKNINQLQTTTQIFKVSPPITSNAKQKPFKHTLIAKTHVNYF